MARAFLENSAMRCSDIRDKVWLYVCAAPFSTDGNRKFFLHSVEIARVEGWRGVPAINTNV